MPILDKITSSQNPRVKDVIRLHKPSFRKEKGLVIVEGLREISMALASGFEIEHVMVCPGLFESEGQNDLSAIISGHRCYEVTQQLFAKMAYREHSDGLLAVMFAKTTQLNDLHVSSNPLIIVLEAVEKPGNLGAILRTADATNVDAVIVCDPLTDIYNPNVIRSSIGCVFSKQVSACTSEEALIWLRRHNISTFAASLTANQQHYLCNFTGPLAFILGSEANGLSDFWLKNSSSQVKIPMLGKTDSLNVSISAAVLLYEAIRQRVHQ